MRSLGWFLSALIHLILLMAVLSAGWNTIKIPELPRKLSVRMAAEAPSEVFSPTAPGARLENLPSSSLFSSMTDPRGLGDLRPEAWKETATAWGPLKSPSSEFRSFTADELLKETWTEEEPGQEIFWEVGGEAQSSASDLDLKGVVLKTDLTVHWTGVLKSDGQWETLPTVSDTGDEDLNLRLTTWLRSLDFRPDPREDRRIEVKVQIRQRKPL